MNAGYFDEETVDNSGGFLFKIPFILWDRRWYIIIPTAVCAVAGTVAAFVMPTKYQSKATLLVESSELGDATSGSPTEEVDRRMAKIRQQLLSRPDLIALIQKYGLFQVADRAEPMSTLVEHMRDATNISAVAADIAPSQSRGGQASSIAFSLSFEYPRPALAQLVAQNFVDKLIKLDTEELRNQADTNVQMLSDQEATLQSRLSELNSQINAIAGQNGAALSSSMGMGSISLGGGNYETQIAELQRQNAQLRAQVGASGISSNPGVVAAEAKLAAARAMYADGHPDVRAAETELVAARNAAVNFQNKSLSGSVAQQIAANNAQIGQLSQARAMEAARASAMAAAQAKGPEVAQRLGQLTAQADLLRAQLGKVQSSLLGARSNADLTEQRKGERLTLIEAPAFPDKPASPNRPLLIAGGLLGGLAIGGVLALLIEMVMAPIRSVGALTRVTGAPPLAVVPVIKRRKARKSFLRFLRKQPRQPISSGV